MIYGYIGMSICFYKKNPKACSSLRCIKQCVHPEKQIRHHINIPTRSNFSQTLVCSWYVNFVRQMFKTGSVIYLSNYTLDMFLLMKYICEKIDWNKQC